MIQFIIYNYQITKLPSIIFLFMSSKGMRKVIDLLSDQQGDQEYKKPINVNRKYSQKNYHHDKNQNGRNHYVYDLQKPTMTKQDIAIKKYYQHNKNSQLGFDIYEFVSNNFLSNKTKLLRCKLCNKKVFDNAMKFQCQKCKKWCHVECLFDPEQCPRCKYNIRLGKYNKPFIPSLKVKDYPKKSENSKIKKQQKIKQTKSNEQYQNQKQSDSMSDYFNIVTPQKQQTKYNFSINLTQVKPQFCEQLNQFLKKEKEINLKNNHIIFPIPQEIINRYSFIQYYIKQKIVQLPSIEILPSHFKNLIIIWNYISYFQFSIQPNQICTLSIQNFQQSIKINPITTFIIPLLKLFYKQFKPPLSNPTNLFKLLQQQNQQNLIEHSAHYFWPVMLFQLIQNMKNVDPQIQKLKQMLKQFHQKRIYEIQQFEQKINVLYYICILTQNCAFFRNVINQYSKNHLQQRQKVQKYTEGERLKLKQKFKSNNQQLNKILQDIRKQKINMNILFNNQVQQYRYQLEKKKQQQIAQLQNIRNQMKQLKKDQQIIAYYYDLHCFNKVVYLGKDKFNRLYWHILDTETNDIIFINFQTELDKTEKDSKNYSGWGFYHGQKIQVMMQSLCQDGVNQHNLKANLKKLFRFGFIRTNSSQKYNLPKIKQYCSKIKTEVSKPQVKPQDEQEIYARQFLKNNIKQINLSQLRKLLIEAHRVYSKIVRKHFGEWKIDQQYGIRIKNQKFKNIKQIIQFVERIGLIMYSLEDMPQKKKRGKIKCNALIWISRTNYYYIWKKLLQSCTKSPQVFMYALILYLQVINATRHKIDPRQAFCKRKYHKNPRQQQFLNQKQSSSQQNSNDSWSGSVEQLRERKKSSSEEYSHS